MQTQIDRAQAFAALHVKGDPLILFNAWDAGSAAVIAKAGAKAIATGSWSVAIAHGFGDGELLPLDLVLGNLARIVSIVELPVSLDFEGCYAREPSRVGDHVARALKLGAIGINFEDRMVGESGIYALSEQCLRLRAARLAAEELGIPAFINARTDLFLQSPEHDGALLDAAIERACAYVQAGANGFFVPGLVDEILIGRLCAALEMPVNVMALPSLPSPERLAQLGVARISHGPRPYRLAMSALESAALTAFGAT